ncbi:MAG: CDP-alcohol phosphatidyltransferase family protein [Desulfobacterales bacterium]
MRAPALKINLPNFLTLCRILATPLIIILMLGGRYELALLVFTLAGITDALDGFIARCFDQKTELGAFLDPIADKALIIASFVTLGAQGVIPAWLSVIVISRDVVILTGIAILQIRGLEVTIHPSVVSKFTTGAQLASVFMALAAIRWAGLSPFQAGFYWATALLTTISGLHYIYVGLGILQAPSDGAGQ